MDLGKLSSQREVSFIKKRVFAENHELKYCPER
jgi:hypothetical protein